MLNQDEAKVIVQLVLTIALLAAGIYVLVIEKRPSPDLQKVASGWLGTLLGFWMK